MIDEEEAFIHVMFGIHAMHVPCQVVLQDNGRTPDGRYLTAVVGVIATEQPIISPEARERRFVHELIVGDMVIRPRGKWASGHFQGHGITALLTGEAMFPEGHEIQTLDNGYRPSTRDSREEQR